MERKKATGYRFTEVSLWNGQKLD